MIRLFNRIEFFQRRRAVILLLQGELVLTTAIWLCVMILMCALCATQMAILTTEMRKIAH